MIRKATLLRTNNNHPAAPGTGVCMKLLEDRPKPKILKTPGSESSGRGSMTRFEKALQTARGQTAVAEKDDHSGPAFTSPWQPDWKPSSNPENNLRVDAEGVLPSPGPRISKPGPFGEVVELIHLATRRQSHNARRSGSDSPGTGWHSSARRG